MKLYIKSFFVLIVLSITSCEDVIEVSVPSAEPRLVIEASLDWKKGTLGNEQTIQLSTSTPYFDTEKLDPLSGASVKVKNTSTGVEYVFIDQKDGSYNISNFEPVINNTYTLEIIYSNETYSATETLRAVSPIKAVEQTLEGGFYDDVLDVYIFWDDPVDEENYYMIRFIEEGDLLPILEDFPDEFVNGNQLDAFFEKDRDSDDPEAEFNPGDVVDISLYGISKEYFNYVRLLIEQYYSGGDPFSAIPVKLKGNCVNIDNPENYAHGYFRLSEFDTVNYTFVEQE
ncbi:DUF4249 domain-containing protein [Algibacter mikhailovii]|uniref:DUF4249 domain-containing protein n=1 Tax=Algibacter mikhailovii TaxID=425498 RepID=A0A918RBI6_9FLAO|nr:DUF4249 domain-containing protein [Algibacter mikhailovii]GGZ89384.1 hypothetical protein GCM10007028_29560 [Algibacter mikhailovii]